MPSRILFFDTDEITEKFFEKHPFGTRKSLFVPYDINNPKTRSIKDLDKVEIISLFAHAQNVENNVLDLFEHLKMITTRSTGFNHLDLNYLRDRGIVLCNVPHYGETTVAEFTIGVMIALCRKIMLAKSEMKANNVHMDKYIGFDLKGRTLGVIGTGAIGSAVIRLARAFGMEIIAFDPYPSEALKKEGICYTDALKNLLAAADIITLHCPATDENKHLLDEKAFAQMKNGVLIVNTARGSLIDTEALYNALQSGKAGGAALDVLENEDVLTHREIALDEATKNHDFFIDSILNFKLLQSEKTIITPHIAFNSSDALARILQQTADNIDAFISGKPKNVVA